MLDVDVIQEQPVSPGDAKYLMIIYGEISGMPPHLSFRRTPQAKAGLSRQHKLKQVKCPHCSTRFADTDDSTRIEVIAKPVARPDPCHLYHKCESCGTVFGINIVIVVS